MMSAEIIRLDVPRGRFRRIGKFTIADHLLFGPDTDVDALHAVFRWADLVPLEIEINHGHGTRTYTALSPLFDPVPPGFYVPEYLMMIYAERVAGVVVVSRLSAQRIFRNEA